MCRGSGRASRLEIHNLGHAVEQLDADIVCLQEVRKLHRRQAQQFTHWPDLPQAEFLAPEGYESVYRTNAVTRHGEHGNALLSRWPVVTHQHEDMSDHRFEQRGLLHVEVAVQGRAVHVIVVHLGLIPASRVRQVAQLQALHRARGAAGGGAGGGWRFQRLGNPQPARHECDRAELVGHRALPDLSVAAAGGAARPDLCPWAQAAAPACAARARSGAQMSDHLPLIAEFGF